MRFSTPWSSKPSSWEDFVPNPSFPKPGMSSPCQAPVHGTPPVVHRFHDLFLLQESPVGIFPKDLPPNFIGRKQNPCTPCPETYCKRPWEMKVHEDGLRWGIFVVFEQAWYWEGTSLGELIESISLTPQEELEIQIFTWDRTKLSRDFESTDLVDKKSEISLTTHDSSHVINRMEKEKQWEFGANVGFEYGVTVGAQLSAGESTRDATERRRERKQELTSKTAQQVRSERKVKISTLREVGTEERTRRLLKNLNPTRSVTYNFYETLSHYRVDIAPVELRLVVAIPNELPKITPCWIVCHEGILRKYLLDETQEVGFEAARKLAVGVAPDPVSEAAKQLRQAFWNQPGAPRSESDPEPQPECKLVPRKRPSSVETAAGTVALIMTLGPLAFLFGPFVQPAEVETPILKPPSFWEIARFLDAVAQTPSLAGLTKAVKMLEQWYTPWTDSEQNCAYSMTPEMDGALALATGAMVYETQELPAIPEGEDETAKEAAKEAWLAWKSEKEQLLQTQRENQASFDGLKCHIENNLLYYMRYIWLSEDPGVRRRYLSQRLGDSEMTVLDSLIEEPLLGFHLNCSVFAVKLTLQEEEKLLEAFRSGQTPQGFSLKSTNDFADQIKIYGSELKEIVGNHFQQLVDRRFQADGSRILNQVVAEGVQHVLTCEKPGNTLTPELLPQVLTQASNRLQEAIDPNQKESNYLNEDEKQRKAAMEQQADALASTEVIADEQNAVIGEFVSVGQWASENATLPSNLKSIMVSLPDGGYHCEPVVGNCSGAEDLRRRELEAEIALRELEVERRKKRLEADSLEPEPPMPTLNIKME